MSFAEAIKAFEEKALLAANTSMSKAVFEHLATNLVTLTGDINIGNYSDGDIANNWHISVGGVNMVIPNGPDRAGPASLARIKVASMEQLFYKHDNKVFITNVMNYSYRANFIGWPKGPGTNGWTWVNNIALGGYGFVGQAINNLKGRYA